MSSILDLWRAFFGEMPALSQNAEFGILLEYAVCAIVAVVVVVLFFRLIIGVINAIFR